MSTADLIDYYANLLILQYVGKPKAFAHIQTIVTPIIMPQNVILPLDGGDAAGFFTDQVDGGPALAAFTGSIDGGGAVANDQTLPLAVQAGFNLLGADTAVGKQLDTLGKYANVTRSVYGTGTTITLGDSDFLAFIRMAIIRNNAGSSLATIQGLLHQFFPGQVLVFDLKNMQMSYMISSLVGSRDLAIAFVEEGLLPKPMGVELASVIYAPDITHFFGFRTYALPGYNIEPFNTYGSYHTDWPWLSYADAI